MKKSFTTLFSALMLSSTSLAQCDTVPIPPSAIVFDQPSGNLAVSLQDIWVCTNGYPGVTGSYNRIYLEANATLAIAGDSNLVWSQGDNYIYINPGSDYNVITHEGTGINIANNGSNNFLFPCIAVTFDYTNAPATGCVGAGIADESPSAQVLLYPTPVTDRLNMKVDGDMTLLEVRVLDLVGHDVARSADPTVTHIDMSGLRAGSYVVHLLTDRGYAAHKVVKL